MDSYHDQIEQCLKHSNSVQECKEILYRYGNEPFHIKQLVTQELFSKLFPHFSEDLSKNCIEYKFDKSLFSWCISMEKFDFAFELHKKIVQKIRTTHGDADVEQVYYLKKILKGNRRPFYWKLKNGFFRGEIHFRISISIDLVSPEFGLR